jgi:hypothetical protein
MPPATYWERNSHNEIRYTIMASFLRGKQAGMQKDLSAGIQPGQFCPDEQSRYGINSQIRHVRFVSLVAHSNTGYT